MSAVGPSLNSLARSRHLASLASSSALSCDEPILVRPAFGEKVRAIHVSIFALKSLERHIAATGDVKYFRNRIPCTGDNCHSGSSYCLLRKVTCAHLKISKPAAAMHMKPNQVRRGTYPEKGKLSARPKLMRAALELHRGAPAPDFACATFGFRSSLTAPRAE